VLTVTAKAASLPHLLNVILVNKTTSSSELAVLSHVLKDFMECKENVTLVILIVRTVQVKDRVPNALIDT
jgi:hypothetical protein